MDIVGCRVSSCTEELLRQAVFLQSIVENVGDTTAGVRRWKLLEGHELPAHIPVGVDIVGSSTEELLPIR